MYAFVIFGAMLSMYSLCFILNSHKYTLLGVYAISKRRLLSQFYSAKFNVRCTEVKVISSDDSPEDEEYIPNFDRKGLRVYNCAKEFRQVDSRLPFTPTDFGAWLPDDLFCVQYKVFNNHAGTSKIHTWLEGECADRQFPGTAEIERTINKPLIENTTAMRMPSGVMTAKIYYDKREDSVDVTAFVHELIPPGCCENSCNIFRLKDLFRFLFYKAYVCPEMTDADGARGSEDYEWRKVLLYFMVIGPEGLAHNYYHPDYNMNDTINLSTGENTSNAFATSIKSRFGQAASWSDIAEAEAETFTLAEDTVAEVS